jgi:hypothetical protein
MKPKNKKKPTPECAWPQFDTLAQCASSSGIPLSVLKKAKAMGCPAFRHSRVYFAQFLPWVFVNMMGAENIDWDDRLVKAKAEKAEHDLSIAKREVIPLEEAAKFIIATALPRTEAVKAMPSKLSALVNPSDPAHARAHLERWRDEYLKLKEQIPLKQP